MRRIFGILPVAGLMALGAAPAQGLNLRIGIGDHGLRRHAARSRIGERRAVRPARSRLACRTVIRERVRASGVVVRSRNAAASMWTKT